MTSQKTDCIPEQFKFEQVKSCPVVVNFKGETVTSDAGLTLIAELVPLRGSQKSKVKSQKTDSIRPQILLWARFGKAQPYSVRNFSR